MRPGSEPASLNLLQKLPLPRPHATHLPHRKMWCIPSTCMVRISRMIASIFSGVPAELESLGPAKYLKTVAAAAVASY